MIKKNQIYFFSGLLYSLHNKTDVDRKEIIYICKESENHVDKQRKKKLL